MPIKTLHITNCYHPSSGGIRTFYHALLEGANRLGRPMRLVVPGEEDRIEEAGEFGRIYQIKSPRTPFFDRRYRLILPHTFLFPNPGGLRRILQIEQPDLVEVCDKYSVCWIAGVLREGWIPGVRRPTLVGMSCERMDDNVLGYITASPHARRLAALYVRKIYGPLFDFHIAVSAYVAAEIREAFPRVRDRLRILPMGVHLEHLGPQHRDPELRRRLQHECGGDGSTMLLLYAGRLSPEKNVALLAGMMEQLAGKLQRNGGHAPDCRLLIAGSGPLEGRLREESAPLGGRIHLLGHLADRAELARLLASVDVFVHPNPREPFGIAPLEAMASGTPLVAPAMGGIKEYADSSCAWLTRPDGESFARAVLDVQSDAAQRDKKVARARGVADRHAWHMVSEKFFATYEALDAARAMPCAASMSNCLAEV